MLPWLAVVTGLIPPLSPRVNEEEWNLTLRKGKERWRSFQHNFFCVTAIQVRFNPSFCTFAFLTNVSDDCQGSEQKNLSIKALTGWQETIEHHSIMFPPCLCFLNTMCSSSTQSCSNILNRAVMCKLIWSFLQLIQIMIKVIIFPLCTLEFKHS